MDLQIFEKNGWKIRTIERDGEPWFVGKGVAEALGFKNYRSAISNNIEEDEKDVLRADTLGGKQLMTIISESGLYALVFKSTKPEAKKFRKWVTSEILPSIRKTGSYSIDQPIPKTFAEALQLAADQAKKIEIQKAELIENRPKVEYFDHAMKSDDGITFNDAAKILNMVHPLSPKKTLGQNKLFQYCRENKILMKNNIPYQQFMDANLFKIIETTYEVRNNVKISKKTLILHKGLDYIMKRMKDDGYVQKK